MSLDAIQRRVERERPEKLSAEDAKEVESFAGGAYSESVAPLSQIIFQSGLRYGLHDGEWLREDVLIDRLQPDGFRFQTAEGESAAP